MTSGTSIMRQAPEEYCPIQDVPSQDWEASSSISITIIEGPAINVWSDTVAHEQTAQDLKLQLQAHQLAVIGRQEGGEIEYLDPQYRPTQMLPNSTQSVLRGSRWDHIDRCVSRGHFMLRASPFGLLFVNGVPRRGGGVRPPLNGTMMVAPAHRRLAEGEELLIEKGASIQVRLPNGTVLMLSAA